MTRRWNGSSLDSAPQAQPDGHAPRAPRASPGGPAIPTPCFDTVTGVYSRPLLVDVLARILQRCDVTGAPLAVVDIDIDRFRMINEAFGQPFGDAVLRDVARRLAGCLRHDDVLARIASDEFAVILPAVGGDLEERVAALAAAIERPYAAEDGRIGLSACLGTARFPADGATAEELLEHAGAALARAKARRARAAVHNGGGPAEARDRLLLEGRLRDALDGDALTIHLQPQVGLSSGRLCGAEALVRWTDGAGRPVPPDRFVPLAEEAGLIAALGERVLRAAMTTVAGWQRLASRPFAVGVNLSALQFAGFGLEDLVSGLLEETGVDPAWIKLELTETALLEDAEHTCALMERLRERGMRFSLDDFGTGFSSLSHLHQFPIDEIKIDRSFVARMAGSAAHRCIVRAVIELAHDLGKTVVAEGVETEDQRRALHALGCDSGQGYLFDAALPPDRFAERWLAAVPA
ncbi:putative bifunctional diguanylate cyclase/phosphodiesterase [Azospirillum sp. ST 5-10]|uniref:putative bifunctional diguanylate cyclase/phosphodiesterase n=1 Tax=unclassified Azospirillum TaxID=2630922 RepID=UPI003F4A2E56